MHWAWSILGAGVVLVVLRDIFHTLWYPTGQGSISRLVMRVWWWTGRRLWRGPQPAALVGPAGMATVIIVWTTLMVLGWALVYAPHMPAGFSFDPTLNPGRGPTTDAVYLSLVALATLGLGDVVPTSAWLRLAVPVQALTGFVLLTAAVSWVLQIYPALTRRRMLSLRLYLLREADAAARLAELDGSYTATLLDGLATEVTAVRVDLTQYGETYYFHDARPSASFPANVGYAHTLAAAAGRDERSHVAMSGALLDGALADLSLVLRTEFLRSSLPERTVPTLEAYAVAHGHHGGGAHERPGR